MLIVILSLKMKKNRPLPKEIGYLIRNNNSTQNKDINFLALKYISILMWVKRGRACKNSHNRNHTIKNNNKTNNNITHIQFIVVKSCFFFFYISFFQETALISTFLKHVQRKRTGRNVAEQKAISYIFRRSSNLN